MTRAQFAAAVRADEKWVENAGRLLGRRFGRTREESRWLGLVSVLSREMGMTLDRAARLADEALAHPSTEGTVVVGQSQGGVAAVSIDIGRYHSAWAAALSAAIETGGARRRGRPRSAFRKKAALIERAADYGVDIDLLRAGLRMTVGERLQQLEENARFISAIRPAGRSGA